jgi:hypothetical protein
MGKTTPSELCQIAFFGARKVAGGRLAKWARRLSSKTNVRDPDFTARTCPAARRRYNSEREMPDNRTASGMATATGSRRGKSVAIVDYTSSSRRPPVLPDIRIDEEFG